ncbi:MAG: ATP-binding cassette subfamily C protein [Lentisphaeria bacterium]|jgi:ATP-binding cassette subfamily C protein
MNKHYFFDLLNGFKDFFYFSPTRQIAILFLMLFQGLTAGVGLLLIIPLLDVIGFNVGVPTDIGISHSVSHIFSYLGFKTTLETILVSYVLIVVAIASLRYKLAVSSSVLQHRYICHIRNQLYRSLLRSNWPFLIQHKMSDFTHCLTGQVQTVGHNAHLMLTFLSQCILTTIMIGLSIIISWQLSLTTLAFSGLLFILLLPLNRILYGSGRTQLMSFKTIFQMLTEQLGSLKMIKSYSAEDYYADKVLQSSELMEAQSVRLTRLTALTQWIYIVVSAAGFGVFLYVALTVMSIPLATLLLLLVIFSRLLPQISNLQKSYQQLVHSVPALIDVRSMTASCQAAEESLISDSGLTLITEIRLDNVSFRYPMQNESVLENVSLHINRNETVALIGPSGIGKTTLADLIAGLLAPVVGKIVCDSTELDDKTRLSWRKNIAYVTQEVYLFHDTIKANLEWVAQNPVSDDAIWNVLKLAAADEFVASLPNGLDTVVGDRGVRLSGGERQRLALARALLSNPQLLILDEATNALDINNELKIQEALQQLRGKLTILIIAHRDTACVHADRQFELTGNQVINHPQKPTEENRVHIKDAMAEN